MEKFPIGCACPTAGAQRIADGQEAAAQEEASQAAGASSRVGLGETAGGELVEGARRHRGVQHVEMRIRR